ncbi:hypothetical protein V2O64_21925 [Verrucomicrobiaceae bacterium 227]
MATNLRLFIFLLLTATITISSAQKKPPMKRNTIPEKVHRIKTLFGPDGANYIEYSESRQIAIIRGIVDITRSRDPEAVTALIDLALYEPFDELDSKMTRKDLYVFRASHKAVCGLLNYPLTELAVIPGPDLPDYPYFDPIDPERRKKALRSHYENNPEEALRDCRAWCQEILDGKRSFQLQGSRHRYNHLGQIINHPPPRIHSTTSPPQTPGPASSQLSLNPKTYWLIALLTLVIIGAIIKLTIRKT